MPLQSFHAGIQGQRHSAENAILRQQLFIELRIQSQINFHFFDYVDTVNSTESAPVYGFIKEVDENISNYLFNDIQLMLIQPDLKSRERTLVSPVTSGHYS